jgi:hypothetical protein
LQTSEKIRKQQKELIDVLQSTQLGPGYRSLGDNGSRLNHDLLLSEILQLRDSVAAESTRFYSIILFSKVKSSFAA